MTSPTNQTAPIVLQRRALGSPSPPLDMVRNPSATTLVYWHLGNRCNYSCSYCPDVLHDGSAAPPTKTAAIGAVTQLYEHYVTRLGRQLAFSFSGGEPTLYPHLADVSRHAKSLSPEIRVTVVSNGGRTLRYWRDILPEIDGAILSYHTEETSVEHFLSVCELLHGEGKLIRIHCNMHLERWEICRSVFEMLRGRGYPIFCKPLYVKFGEELYPYSQPQIDFIRGNSTSSLSAFVSRGGVERFESIENIITRGEIRYRGWVCHAGLECLMVSPAGNISRAECGIGRGLMGNIADAAHQQLTLPSTPTVCDRSFCNCIIDLTLSKRPTPIASIPA